MRTASPVFPIPFAPRSVRNSFCCNSPYRVARLFSVSYKGTPTCFARRVSVSSVANPEICFAVHAANSRNTLPALGASLRIPLPSATFLPLTHTPRTPMAGVVTREAPAGRSKTRSARLRPTVCRWNSRRSACMPGLIEPRSWMPKICVRSRVRASVARAARRPCGLHCEH